MMITVRQTEYEAYQRARTALYAMTKNPTTRRDELEEQRKVVLEMHHALFYGDPGARKTWAGTAGTIETPHPLG